MKHKKTKNFILMLLIIIVLSPFKIYAMTDSEIQRVTNQIKPQINQATPVFENIITTVYHTVSSKDYTQWHSGASQNHDVSTRLGWCVIPIPQRGFYEDVMCQGSGVHENKVYHYTNIQTNQADSIPLESKYTRGRTAKSTDPKPKWTVAVNNQPGTPCYIPYGTILYIDFGAGNPWTGLYRAEDTGAAFGGQCKIDIYAGVGLEASREAERHVSGKTPEIYVLEPTISAPPSLSSTELAETYRIITPEEYVAKHGSQVLTSRYIPRLDPEFNQVGEILLPYSSQTIIRGINYFYETIREFSKEVLNDCTNKDPEQKLACAYNKAKEYQEKNIIITSCSNTNPPISTQNINPAEIISVSGFLTEISEQTNTINLTLKQNRAETINIEINKDPQTMNLLTQKNQFISINNINITNKINQDLKARTTTTTQIQTTNQTDEQTLKENMKTISLTLSDCQTNNNCTCAIPIIKTNAQYQIRNNQITTQGISIQINTQLQENINPLAEKVIFQIQNNQATQIINELETTNNCQPTKTHAIFCAKPNTQGKTYFEKTFYPKMNFALKI